MARGAGGPQRMSSSWEGTGDWSGLERMPSGVAGHRAGSARFATVSASSVSSVRRAVDLCMDRRHSGWMEMSASQWGFLQPGLL